MGIPRRGGRGERIRRVVLREDGPVYRVHRGYIQWRNLKMLTRLRYSSGRRNGRVGGVPRG